MWTTWVGAALIIASGLYIAWREHRHARRIATG
jgi:drug/metabolite transporter (DMT)-like permease